MNDKQTQELQRILNETGFLKQIKKTFDYSFETEMSEKDGKLRISFIARDTGNDIMTLGDVSAMLQMDRNTIKQMTESRAQRSTVNPIPFFKVGRMLRFSRAKIVAWLETSQAAPVLPPVKGKIKRAK